MKKLAIVLTTALIAGACLSGCSGSANTNTSGSSSSNSQSEEAADSQWDYSNATVATLPSDVQKAFDKATNGYTGGSFEPVAYLGSQVVSGTNYSVLCRETLTTNPPEEKLVVVTIYNNLKGKAKVTGVVDFDLDNLPDATESSEGTTGGWTVDEDAKAITLDESVQSVFDLAVGTTDTDAVPVAYLGTQVSDGTTEYAVLYLDKGSKKSGATLNVAVMSSLGANAAGTIVMGAINPADFTE